jgi:hypothetical protein
MAKKECDMSPDGKHEPVNDVVVVTIKGKEHITYLSVCNWCGKIL